MTCFDRRRTQKNRPIELRFRFPESTYRDGKEMDNFVRKSVAAQAINNDLGESVLCGALTKRQVRPVFAAC